MGFFSHFIFFVGAFWVFACDYLFYKYTFLISRDPLRISFNSHFDIFYHLQAGYRVTIRKRKIPTDTFSKFEEPIRSEIFTAAHMERHAEIIASRHDVSDDPSRGVDLSKRLLENEDILIESFELIVKSVREERSITPAAEWLIDNFYIIEEQIKDIRDHLPPEYYKELPKLALDGFKGYPRVFAIAWEFVAHTDSRFDPDLLKSTLKSYQKVRPLTMGELWAISITLRLVMVENLRRLCARIVGSQISRAHADQIADELLGLGKTIGRTDQEIIAGLQKNPISIEFAVQLVQRLRFQEGVKPEVLAWFEKQLIAQGFVADKIVQDVHTNDTTANVTVRNIITSMRLMSSLDWCGFFEEVSLVDDKLSEHPLYLQMDFITRDKYRHSIEELARGSTFTEIEIAKSLVLKTGGEQDLGFYLISSGRYEFEKIVNFKLKPRKYLLRWYVAHRELFYLGSLFLLTIFLVSLCPFNEPYLLGFLGLFPASELALALINRITVQVLSPRHLPRLDFSKKIPVEYKTFVVVPTMLVKAEEIINQLDQLEVHYLSNPDDSVYFALLSDWKDAPTEHLASDEDFLSIALKQLDHLNHKYGHSSEGKNRFYLFHRYRKWNISEQKWIGYERKRGKLQEFNRFLRGAKDTTFIVSDKFNLDIPRDVNYVITLDGDTKLPRGSVAQLVGTLAHPLNHPKIDPKLNRVVDGYGILQPRITPTLPSTEDSTFFQRLSSGPCGIDPYAAAVSDVYQDLFGEGSYTGKGIYNVDVFEQVLKGRTPEDRLLSHDLFEGNFARCGLLSDVELFEDFPSNFEVAVARNHRWIRGDWQLSPWILGRGGKSISIMGRWKMIDNLRRSLFFPACFFLLMAVFMIPNIHITAWLVLVLSSLGLPHLLPFLTELFSYQKKIPLVVQLRSVGEDLFLGIYRFIFNLVFLPYITWVHMDAVGRTLLRLGFTKRKLLEWTSSAQSKSSASTNLLHFFKRMLGSELLLILLGYLVFKFNPLMEELFIPLYLLWFLAPFVAWRISLPPVKDQAVEVSEDDLLIFRDSARMIWHFFSTFVTAEENYLPPDNFQEAPEPIVAHRSSPTNFGLYLLSVITARDFGWIGLHEMADRLEHTLQSMMSLPRFDGHFYNWYETTSKRALEPRYISSVDNGNLAGHLLALAQSCEEAAGEIEFPAKALSGIKDSLRILGKKISRVPYLELRGNYDSLVKSLSSSYSPNEDRNIFWEKLLGESERMYESIKQIDKANGQILVKSEAQHWALAISAEIKSHARDTNIADEVLKEKLLGLAVMAREIFYEMDFSFLYDRTRKLFSIGYRMSDSCLDASYYDLLASEARLLSFVAIAKGDVPVEHWFRLGRSLTPVEKGTALISWSGSMFEYLMPSLVMCTPVSSLLDQTCRLVVKKQITYAKEKSIPWGMSESAYNSRDLHFTYQYSNFGVPELAYKRGIGKDLVIAPYATILAAMYDPLSAALNLKHLSSLKMIGAYGFYESIDFTKARLPEKEESAIVKTYMAHHQGMSLVAISNIINNGIMLKRFHREPIIHSCELLLQERTPRNVAVAKTRVESVKVEHVLHDNEANYRQYFTPNHLIPRTHLLSNGHYSVMITAAGSGYSSFRDMAVTRWREDVTRDHWGSYIYLRDIYTNDVWSAGHQPICVDAEMYEVIFTEDRAKITRQDKLITSLLEVLISPEDNAEIRRQNLSNNGPEVRVIEVTTYAEIVLNTQGADIAHPIFSNLFVQTEYIPEITTLLATRRPRSPQEIPVWMAYVISTDANSIGEIEYETDRSLFIGRGRSTKNPISLESKKLSNTVGSVLDPIVSFRSRVRIDPGATATITYSTIMGSSREEVLHLAEKFHETSSYERNSNLAWTQAQVKLHYLGINDREANLYQQLANKIIYLDSSLRVSSDVLKRNNRNASDLWAYGISGDYPIVLVRISEVEQRNLVRQVLRAHEYWGTKRLVVDLVILNEKSSSYSQELHNDLEVMIAHSAVSSGVYLPHSKGKVFLLRGDLIPKEDHHLLQTAARATLTGRQGNLAEQVNRMVRKIEKHFSGLRVQTSAEKKIDVPLKIPKLNFFNGLGGFTDNGLEYIIHLKKEACTPAPWINVVANSHFGFHVSESGAGSTWSLNSRENQLTPWSNDPVTDPTGECFYIFDQDRSELWSPTYAPIRIKNAEYLIRHGQGYSQFELRHVGIHSTLTQFVHKNLPVKISKLVLKNESNIRRNLTITSYNEWVLGFSRALTSSFLVTEYDKKSESLMCHNPWNQGFGSRMAFASFVGGSSSWTGKRTEFIGRNGHLGRPVSLLKNINLSGSTSAGVDTCAALMKKISIPANGETTIVFLLGQEEDVAKAQDLIKEISEGNIDQMFHEVVSEWNNVLEKIQVKTPDLSMNIMLNRWLLYQTTVCRLWARTAFYQAGGAFGFRDQLQDSMAVIWTKPEMIKAQILRAAGRQFIEGDVQHWWHMPTGRGVRTHFSDDLLWLPYVVSYYVNHSKDFSVLDETMPFLSGPLLTQEQEDSYYTPVVSTETGSIYEHCARAIDHSLAVGAHGLPLMGGGDWNDGMNRVGHEGRGESVWMAWFLIANLNEFSKIAETRGDRAHAEKWKMHSLELKKSIEANAWDGEWYRRAYYDNGAPLGSKESSECQIDSLAQSWGVISKAGDKNRVLLAMDSVEKNLVKNNEKIILLFTPPFDKTSQDPGYIKGYIPGVRENGGQYTHAGIWCMLAYAGLSNGKRAVELFSMLNPINHSLNSEEADRYKVEPYVVAADIYSQYPHVGRGGWTWYTGSAGWLYSVGLEALLGFKLSGTRLHIEPRIDPQWESYQIVYRHQSSTYEIEVKNPNHLSAGVGKMTLDGVDHDYFIDLVDDGLKHNVLVTLLELESSSPS